MKFSINATEFRNALGAVSKGADSHSAQPILAGIFIKAEKDTVTLESTNLDVSIRCTLPALIEDEGVAVIPSKLLVDVVKSLPDSAIHIEVEEGSDRAHILCETSTFALKLLNAEDFPSFPEITDTNAIHIPFDVFRKMVKRVAKVTSRDESRAILTGILIEVINGNIRMVATDTYRLAITEAPFAGDIDEFSVVIAGSFMQDLAALPFTSNEIELSVAENQVIIHYASTTFISRRIEGNFPPYNQLIPDSYQTKVTFTTKQLLDAVKRTSLLSNRTAPLKLDCHKESQTTLVSTATQDIGTANETLHSEIEGEDVEIAFNFGYTIEGLTSVESDKVFLELQGSQRPGIFKADSAEPFLYLIMPIRLQ